MHVKAWSSEATEVLDKITKKRAPKPKKVPEAQKAPVRQTHAEYAKKHQGFKDACELVGLPATARQASKYRRKLGAAFSGKAVPKKGLIVKKNPVKG